MNAIDKIREIIKDVDKLKYRSIATTDYHIYEMIVKQLQQVLSLLEKDEHEKDELIREMKQDLKETSKIYKYLMDRYEKSDHDPTIHNAIPKHKRIIDNTIQKAEQTIKE